MGNYKSASGQLQNNCVSYTMLIPTNCVIITEIFIQYIQLYCVTNAFTADKFVARILSWFYSHLKRIHRISLFLF